MANIVENTLFAIHVFPIFAIVFTIVFAVDVLQKRKVNFLRLAANYAFVLYVITFFALVFLPLPTMEVAEKLSTHDMQCVPFRFVADIVRQSPLVITDVHTYMAALTDKAVLQVVFNVLLTVPFGIFLTNFLHRDVKKVVIASFALSLFVEVAQLTGLFFLFNGSYRLFDVDDLMANTIGGFLGYRLVSMTKAWLPSIERFDFVLVTGKVKRA